TTAIWASLVCSTQVSRFKLRIYAVGPILCKDPSEEYTSPTERFFKQVCSGCAPCSHAPQSVVSLRTNTWLPRGDHCRGEVGPKRTSDGMPRPAARWATPESLP